MLHVPHIFFKKLPKNQITADFIYLTSSNFVTKPHINYWDQVNSWKNLWKFLNGPLCKSKSDPFPLLNVAEYWKSSNTETCAKTLSQIFANNIDNRGRGIGLRIYVRYCRSIYVVNVWSIFHFHHHFHYDLPYNLMNANTLVPSLHLINPIILGWQRGWRKWINFK